METAPVPDRSQQGQAPSKAFPAAVLGCNSPLEEQQQLAGGPWGRGLGVSSTGSRGAPGRERDTSGPRAPPRAPHRHGEGKQPQKGESLGFLFIFLLVTSSSVEKRKKKMKLGCCCRLSCHVGQIPSSHMLTQGYKPVPFYQPHTTAVAPCAQVHGEEPVPKIIAAWVLAGCFPRENLWPKLEIF